MLRQPPGPNFAEHQGILEVLRCVIGPEGAVYLATPITGGDRFLEWYKTEGRHLHDVRRYNAIRQAEVITRNCEEAVVMAEALRHALGGVVIDPSRFFIHQWSQLAYRALWGEVVRRFARAIHFNKGWWLSVGCAHEFMAAVNKGIPLFEGLAARIAPEHGLQRLKIGVETLENVGADTSDLRQTVGEIEESLRRLP